MRAGIVAFCFGIVWAAVAPALGIPVWSVTYWAVLMPTAVAIGVIVEP
jgi:hypothetical protein